MSQHHRVETAPPAVVNPRVSVILPIYNRLRFLSTAFEAIRSQSMPSLEVVVVDDGSTDDSRQFVSNLTSSYPHQIRYIAQENQGAYGARNRGIAAAHGD